MANVVAMNTKSLQEKALRINSLYDIAANSYMETAAIMAEALEVDFHNDKAMFLEWAQETTPYSRRHIDRHLIVYEEFGTGAMSYKYPVPINVLERLALQKQNIPGEVRRKILRMYQNKTAAKRPSQQEALTLINDALPPSLQRAIVVSKPFAERINQPEGFVMVAEKLLDVTTTTCAETIKIIARHWKNKYHPDKGGDAKVFNWIVKAEKVLLKKRGEV